MVSMEEPDLRERYAAILPRLYRPDEGKPYDTGDIPDMDPLEAVRAEVGDLCGELVKLLQAAESLARVKALNRLGKGKWPAEQLRMVDRQKELQKRVAALVAEHHETVARLQFWLEVEHRLETENAKPPS